MEFADVPQGVKKFQEKFLPIRRILYTLFIMVGDIIRKGLDDDIWKSVIRKCAID